MIMRLGRKTGHEFFVAKAALPALGGCERRLHRSRVGACFAAQVDLRVWLGIEQVIAFILGVMQAELLLNITGQGMDLQRQIAAAHGIEQVETDGEFCAEAADTQAPRARPSVRRKPDRSPGLRFRWTRNGAGGYSPLAHSRNTRRSWPGFDRDCRLPSSTVRPTARDRKTEPCEWAASRNDLAPREKPLL